MLTVCRDDFGEHLYLGRNDARGLTINVKQMHIRAWLTDPLTPYEIIPHLAMNGIFYTLGTLPAGTPPQADKPAVETSSYASRPGIFHS